MFIDLPIRTVHIDVLSTLRFYSISIKQIYNIMYIAITAIFLMAN